MSTQIKYKDKIITSFESGTITLHTDNSQLDGDLEIISTGEHVIEVAVLPTENIVENAVYKCGDSYYKYAKEFKDILILVDSQVISVVDMFTSEGMIVRLRYVKTRPTENIIISGEFGIGVVCGFYYVEDENDVLVYGDISNSGTNEWVSFATLLEVKNVVVITDISQVTSASDVYALVDKGSWKEYLSPSGSVTVTSNAAFDVTDKRKVIVDVPIPDGYIVPSENLLITRNGTIDVTQYASATVNVEPNLQERSITANGVVFPDSGFDGLSKITVNVPPEKITVVDSPIPVNVSTEADMDSIFALATSEDNGRVYKYIGEGGRYSLGAQEGNTTIDSIHSLIDNINYAKLVKIDDEGSINIVTDPLVDTKYKLSIKSTVSSEYHYFNGTIVDGRLQTSTIPDDAVDIFVESITKKFAFYFMQDNEKTYIDITADGKITFVKEAPSALYTFYTQQWSAVVGKYVKNAYYKLEVK